MGNLIDGEDQGEKFAFHDTEEDGFRYQSPYGSQPRSETATPDAPSPHTGTSGSPGPGETVSLYGNPYAQKQIGAQADSSLLQMPYYTAHQLHVSTTASRPASHSPSLSKGDTPAASASPTNGDR